MAAQPLAALTASGPPDCVSPVAVTAGGWDDGHVPAGFWLSSAIWARAALTSSALVFACLARTHLPSGASVSSTEVRPALIPQAAVRSRAASHSAHELVAVQAVRYQEYSVPFQVDRVLELLICRFDCFFRDTGGPQDTKEVLLRHGPWRGFSSSWPCAGR